MSFALHSDLFSMSLSRSTQASASVSALAVRRSASVVTIPDSDNDENDPPYVPPVQKKQKFSRPFHSGDSDDDFVSVSSSLSSDDEVGLTVSSLATVSPSPKKKGRPAGTKNTRLKSVSTSALPTTTRQEMFKDKTLAEEVLKELTLNQPAVSLTHIQPRNKDRKKKQSLEVIGAVYNAHRMRLLCRTQLGLLKQKLDEIGYVVKPDGCWVAKAGKKNQATFADPDAAKRPRGLSLDTRYKGIFGTQTFELTQIQLYCTGVYPSTSEDEVSHLCHNNYCINPGHLLWELHPDNIDRDRCRHTRDIQCPSCTHVFTICDHNPKCVACTC